MPSSNNRERFVHALGWKGLQENLANKYKVKVLDIVHEGQGFNTYKIEKPDGFSFIPGSMSMYDPENLLIQ